MWNNIIGQHIRRVNRNLILSNALLLLGALFLLAVSIPFLLRIHRGPLPLPNDKLESGNGISAFLDDYVAIEGEKAVDTGGQEVMQTRKGNNDLVSESVKAYYLLQPVGDHVLLIKTTTNEEGQTKFTGTLQSIPSDDQSKIVDPILADNPELKGRVLPYMLDSASDNYSFGSFLLIVCVLSGGLAFWNFLKLPRRLEPGSHPIAKSLKFYGDPLDIAHTIDREAQQGIQQISDVTLTRSWLLRPTTYKLGVLRLDDIVWIYKKVTQHRTNGINTYKSYDVVLSIRYGNAMQISGPEGVINTLLTWIGASRPWILQGYDDQIVHMWRTDSAGLVAIVDQRRQQGEQAAAQPESTTPSAAEGEGIGVSGTAPSGDDLSSTPSPDAPMLEPDDPSASSQPEFDILPPNGA